MNILILTCNTGEGHNSVAESLKEVFEEHGSPCQIEDALSFLSERVSEFVSKWHTRFYRYMSTAWKAGYRFMESHSEPKDEDGLIVQYLSTGAERLHAFVVSEGYDYILCPHVIASLMVSRMTRMWPEDSVITCYIATDYGYIFTLNNCIMDRYILPTAEDIEEHVSMGIPADRIDVVPGIPVRRAFFQKTDQKQSRLLLGLPQQQPVLLAMCGSMGCGPLDEVTELLVQKMPQDISLVVICGTNQRLFRRLNRQFGNDKRVHLLGYSDQIPLYMDAADLFLTKPGGISTAEAAVKGLPMVLVDAVAACEEQNRRWFCQRGGAVTADSPEELASACLNLLQDKQKLQEMSKALDPGGDAALAIVQLLTQEEEPR